MKISITPRLLLAFAGASFIALSSSQAQQTIYADSFSGAGTGPIAGTTPPTSRTGAAWLGQTRNGTAVQQNATLAAAQTNNLSSVALSLASVPSPFYTISANLSTGNLSYIADPSTTRGVGLGFYSAYPSPGNADPFSPAFTGFVLQIATTGEGTLFFVDGTATRVGVQVGTGLTSSTANFYNLSYTVTTGNGNLSSLTFNGTDFTSSFATAAAGQFTTGQTNFAGFGGSSSAAGSGYVDNFSLVAVPEPSLSALLIGAAGIGFIALRRRRMMQRA